MECSDCMPRQLISMGKVFKIYKHFAVIGIESMIF